MLQPHFGVRGHLACGADGKLLNYIPFYTSQEAPEVECEVVQVKSVADAGREVARSIGGMRQTHRGPMLLVVQVTHQ